MFSVTHSYYIIFILVDKEMDAIRRKAKEKIAVQKKKEEGRISALFAAVEKDVAKKHPALVAKMKSNREKAKVEKARREEERMLASKPTKSGLLEAEARREKKPKTDKVQTKAKKMGKPQQRLLWKFIKDYPVQHTLEWYNKAREAMNMEPWNGMCHAHPVAQYLRKTPTNPF